MALAGLAVGRRVCYFYANGNMNLIAACWQCSRAHHCTDTHSPTAFAQVFFDLAADRYVRLRSQLGLFAHLHVNPARFIANGPLNAKVSLPNVANGYTVIVRAITF
jgi:hypothetical protein